MTGVGLALQGVVSPRPAAADPAVTGQWDAVRKWPAVAVHLLMLHTGQVLFFRGDEAVPKGFLWDPTSETITPVPPPTDNLFCSGHSFLADGRVFVTGGALPGSLAGNLRTLLFDPVTAAWSRGPDMRKGRFYPTNVTLGDGRVLIASGKDASRVLVPEVEVFVPGGPGGADRIDLLTGADRKMNYYPRLHLLPSGEVVHVGEETTTDALDPVAARWRVLGTSAFGRRYEGTSVMLPPGHGRFMIMGGGPKGAAPTATAEILDLAAPVPAWRATQPMHFARTHLQNVILPDGTVLVIGGTNAAGAVLPAEVFDPATETWTVMASLASKRGYHSTAVLLPDARVLEAGANGNPTREIFSPPYLFRGPRPAIDAAPGGVDYGQAFRVATRDAATITSLVLIRPGASTHAANMEQRYVPLAFSPSMGGEALDVLAPADRNVAPPGYYMLFAVNGAGVPSVAPFVLLGSSAPPPPLPTTTSTTTSTTTTTLPAGAVAVAVRVAAGSDDAEEGPTGVVSLTSGDLELIHDVTDQTVGLRFAGVNVPAGATILSASVQFKVDEVQSGATTLVIQGQAADHAATFTTAAFDVSARRRTTVAVRWASMAPWTVLGAVGAPQRTPDLAPVIQEIVGRPGWSAGNALALVIGGTGHRTAEAFEGDRLGAPLLEIVYLGAAPITTTTIGTTTTTMVSVPPDPPTTTTLPDPPTTTTTATTVTTTTTPPPVPTVIEVRIAASADDAEEHPTGVVELASSDVELIHEIDDQVVGLRFPAMRIPAGATITGAWVQFKADETQAGATTVVIRAQAADDAPPFVATVNDVSARPRTIAAVTWAGIPPWAAIGDAGPAQRTPDLAPVIQEIVARPGWAPGQALALIVTGTGRRTAESFDGDLPGSAALLHVEYRP